MNADTQRDILRAANALVQGSGTGRRRRKSNDVRTLPWRGGVGEASRAMGVHPTQIEEFRKKSIADGVPTDFTSDGRPIITSADHQRRYAQSRGIYNNDANWSPRSF